ncbi:MAG: 3-isopropylmalate dehydrogenase [Bacillota bacterium]|nr:3-isopropylmalate dehydrogenase [Bacillota bacterium]
MKYNIAVIKGDGIGPEIIDEAVSVLRSAAIKFGRDFVFREAPAGGNAYDAYGTPIPKESMDICKASDAVLLGAVGGPKWNKAPVDKRPEAALFALRKELNLYANIRPAVIYPSLKKACPLKDEIIGDKLDLVIIRELTGGIYFGKRGRVAAAAGEAAYDTMFYSRFEIERIGRKAFELAMLRGKKLCSVDKANVLESSRLWRETMHSLSQEFPEVLYSELYVDNAAMQLVKNPRQFDVIVTENMFGDILSDEASMITGSIGMLPSASMGEGSFGLYEPIHGSAPDIAGKGIANPIAAILSGAMMLRYSFGLKDEADCIENAVSKALDSGFRTTDIAAEGEKSLGTHEMAGKIIDRI